jgi:predicted O-linked N-acetylglucosamine transferase (SPINDLY family)
MGYLKFVRAIGRGRENGMARLLDSTPDYLAHYYYATMSTGEFGEGQDPVIESCLRTCIKLNPRVAPAYDALALYLARDPAKITEAHMLNIQAVMLEQDDVNYRLNTAVVLSNNRRYLEALSVLKTASYVASTPDDVMLIQTRMNQLQEYIAQLERNHDTQKATVSTFVSDTRTITMTNSYGGKVVVRADSPSPKYPSEAPAGPHHIARGTLRNMHCSLELSK